MNITGSNNSICTKDGIPLMTEEERATQTILEQEMARESQDRALDYCD